jgi:hypothetical protein
MVFFSLEVIGQCQQDFSITIAIGGRVEIIVLKGWTVVKYCRIAWLRSEQFEKYRIMRDFPRELQAC